MNTLACNHVGDKAITAQKKNQLTDFFFHSNAKQIKYNNKTNKNEDIKTFVYCDWLTSKTAVVSCYR